MIGESTTPLTNLYLEQIAEKYDLDEIRSFCKWGSWQQAHPDIAVGLKRGFSFFYHEQGKPLTSDATHANQLLVAASPHNRIADTHWFRSEFDAFLVRRAEQYGAELFENTVIDEMNIENNYVQLRGIQAKKDVNIKAYNVIDASGPRGFCFNKRHPGEAKIDTMPATCGLYNHFRDVGRMDRITNFFNEQVPYPVDDAAIHHIFDDGWMWVLRFNNGIVSAGVSVKDTIAKKYGLADGSKAWERILDRFPTIKDQFHDAKPLYKFRYLPKLGFRSNNMFGNRWVMAPSAYSFIDPLLSMGFPLNLRGIMRLGMIMEEMNPRSDISGSLDDYAEKTRKESELASLMIGGLYARLGDFELFSALSLIYFAAASYSETAIRLGKADMTDSFLLGDRPGFGIKMRRCFSMALHNLDNSDRERLLSMIYETIKPVDIAGLSDRSRHNRFPVIMDDLADNAAKLNVDPEVAIRLLRKIGF